MEEQNLRERIGNFIRSIRVGNFLAYRQVKRGPLWVNILIISVMIFTFLNLVVVSGILVGLIEGAVQAVERHHTGDIIVSSLSNRSYIERSSEVINTIDSVPEVENYAPRYIESGVIDEERTDIKKPSEEREEVGVVMSGIHPDRERRVTDMDTLLVEGSYLDEDDTDEVMLGALLLEEYSGFESESFPVLEGVDIGDDVYIEIGGNKRDVEVKGILRSKVDEIDRRVFFAANHFRKLIGRFDFNVDEIAIQLKKGVNSDRIRDQLIASGIDQYAKVQTREDAEPKVLKDLKTTFSILGNIISSIGLIVASITVFIVIFISAITRRKYIGILQGIGVEDRAIEVAYVLQAIFYAIVGTIIGLGLIFFVLKPYIAENPIDFPFADGVLVTTTSGIIIRMLVLFLATLIAGYVPAWIIARQNTLDAILDR